jgi:hypothetical protein
MPPQMVIEYFRARRDRGIDGLLLADWRGSLLIVCGRFVALFFALGLWWVYWRAADMDAWMVYEAFLVNDRLPQTYFDHSGYPSRSAPGSSCCRAWVFCQCMP